MKTTYVFALLSIGALAGHAAPYTIDFESSLSSYSAYASFNVVGGASEIMVPVTPPSGNWGMMGTNGDSHLGMWADWGAASKNGGWSGPSDTAYGQIKFTEDFYATLDLFSAEWGSSTIFLYGFNEGLLVDTVEVTLTVATVNGVSEYLASGVTFDSPVDEIRYEASAPIGMDNLVLGAIPEPASAALLGGFFSLGVAAGRRRRRA